MIDEVLSRRGFLHGAAAGGLMLTLAAARAQEAAAAGDGEEPAITPPVGCGVIGTGRWGREILRALAAQPGARLLGYADPSEAALRGAQKDVPEPAGFQDHRQLLELDGLEAVFVATPSHLHLQPVQDALAAGKHVYCEAPLASSLEEAKAIAKLGRDADTVFQPGLQHRANPLWKHVLGFVWTGVLADLVAAKGHWHRKDSWYRVGGTPERERELNWRLRKESSSGLLGEVGIHQLDWFNWSIEELPLKVSGFGDILHWRDDDREIPDTVQAVIEYPGGLRLVYDASLSNSFDGMANVLMGSDGTILLREERGWLMKEADAPTLGWEVYAARDQIGNDVGIALVADATKLLDKGIEPGTVAEKGVSDVLPRSLEGFLRAVRLDEDPPCTAEDGYVAAVTALKAHQAVMDGTTVEYAPEDFELD